MIRRTHNGVADGSAQTSISGGLRPEYRAVNLGAVESFKGWHDYGYGLSKASLRPVVPVDEDWDMGGRDTRIPVKPKPRKKIKRRTRSRIEHTVRRIQPVLFPIEDEVDMPDDINPDEVPWWMDEDVLTERNEAMLSDLLSESQ